MRAREQLADGIELRRLERSDLARIGEIDRTERIDAIYVQEGESLREVRGEFSAPPWSRGGRGEHSVAHQRDECERLLAAGGVALGAFDEGRLVGIGVVLPRFRSGVAQLAFLHVGDGYRGRGLGGAIADELERHAREAGAGAMVVSATPSENTVRFYLDRGFAPSAAPVPELYEREPEDVHMEKSL